MRLNLRGISANQLAEMYLAIAKVEAPRRLGLSELRTLIKTELRKHTADSIYRAFADLSVECLTVVPINWKEYFNFSKGEKALLVAAYQLGAVEGYISEDSIFKQLDLIRNPELVQQAKKSLENLHNRNIINYEWGEVILLLGAATYIEKHLLNKSFNDLVETSFNPKRESLQNHSNEANSEDVIVKLFGISLFSPGSEYYQLFEEIECGKTTQKELSDKLERKKFKKLMTSGFLARISSRDLQAFREGRMNKEGLFDEFFDRNKGISKWAIKARLQLRGIDVGF